MWRWMRKCHFNMAEINEHILKLTGKCSLEAPLKLRTNYQIDISGTVTSITQSDNEDGTENLTYRFEPVLALIKNEFGKSTKK